MSYIYLSIDRYNRSDGLFFERDPTSLSDILNFYRTKSLHWYNLLLSFCKTVQIFLSTRLTCPLAYRRELAYWGVSDLYMEPCWQKTYQKKKEMMKKAKQMEEMDIFQFSKTIIGRIRQWWWYLLEYPNFSIKSRIVAFVSFFFVFLSSIVLVVSMVLEDLHKNQPAFKQLKSTYFYQQ